MPEMDHEQTMIREKSILDYVGHTPLIKVDNIWCKLEYLNPSGSTKDRIAKYIIEKAEETGKLKPGYNVVEATSGNSGIAFAMVCAIKGYKMQVIMPDGLTNERVELLKAYGAEIIYTPKQKNLLGKAVELEEIMGNKPGWFAVKQFENEWNVDAHEKTLGQEILREVPGEIDVFVAGVGTGGTLIGVGKALKKKYPNVRLVAVEPEESAIMHWEKPSHHMIEGIGDGFLPKIIENHLYMVDEVITVNSKDAIRETVQLAKKGILAGISSGANLLAAKQLQKKGYKNIVTVFPDRGDRYLSMGFY